MFYTKRYSRAYHCIILAHASGKITGAQYDKALGKIRRADRRARPAWPHLGFPARQSLRLAAVEADRTAS